ncbi:pentatricopeptide repeat-containing protein 1, mitochondrial isoform X2 [Paroedura picta]|uniref:pentatricopeptide repeat-containing protein 1, mitochondrial isoform X2 n=1 Tax=Paroedura picta TaxID=143630 RepID=UPI0040569D2E
MAVQLMSRYFPVGIHTLKASLYPSVCPACRVWTLEHKLSAWPENPQTLLSSLCSRSFSSAKATGRGRDLNESRPAQSSETVTEEEADAEEGFGTLSEKFSSRRFFQKATAEFHELKIRTEWTTEEEELKRKPWRGRRNTPYWYFLRCKALIKEDKLAEALDLFEGQMLKEERLQPEEMNYTVLIGGCGRVGYLKKAFSLYNDEMVQKGHSITTETFNFLLMGCIKDKESGFRFALQLWQQMAKLDIRPDGYTYNLMLTAARECSLGDPLVASELLLRVPEESSAMPRQRPGRQRQRAKDRGGKELGPAAGPQLNVEDLERRMFPEHLVKPAKPLVSQQTGAEEETTMLDSGTSENLPALRPNRLVPSFSTANGELSPGACSSPNLLDFPIPKDNLVSLGTVDTPSDRLALMGNLEGFLKKMREDDVAANIKTFTLLGELVEPGSPSESSLLAVLEEHNVRPDLTFFNTLVRKKSKQGDLKGAKSLLPVLVKKGLSPNLHTFCNLAIACYKQVDGMQLLADMKRSRINPNIHIYGALINAAVKKLDYAYLIDILRDMSNTQTAPNEFVLKMLEFAAQYPPDFDPYKTREPYLAKINGFRAFYFRWLKWMAAEEQPHPWAKYRTGKESRSPASTGEE